MAIYFAVTRVKTKSISLFGFSFQEEHPEHINSHYFNDRSDDEAKIRLWNHDMKSESQVINALIEENRDRFSVS